MFPPPSPGPPVSGPPPSGSSGPSGPPPSCESDSKNTEIVNGVSQFSPDLLADKLTSIYCPCGSVEGLLPVQSIIKRVDP